MRMGAWHVECIGCQPTQRTHMTQVNVQRGDRVLIVVQDRALIKHNLRPTVGPPKTKYGHRREKTRLGATVKAKAFYGRENVIIL